MRLPMAHPPARGHALPSGRAVPTRRNPAGWVRAAATAGAGLLMVPGLVVTTAAPAAAQPACTVEYTVQEWTTQPGQGGFQALLTVTNGGTSLTGWQLSFTFPAGQQVLHGWNATWAQDGADVSATDLPWNRTFPAGGSLELGLVGSWTGSNPPPEDFALNGIPCNEDNPGEPGPGESGPGDRLDNPYQDAQVYVNPDWAQQVLDQAADTPGPLGDQMAQVAAYPTAVWLDEIADITAGRGLAGHLDEALAQDADLIQLVIYNLPNRSCDERGPNGELLLSANGEQRYRSEFIDPIAEIISRPEYADLRIVVVVEPQALVTLVVSATTPTLSCLEVQAADAYVDGIRYAVSELGAIPNAYLYLDLSHAGLLGYDSNLDPTALLAAEVVAGPGGPGFDHVAGFATNVGNYVATEEVFLPDPEATLLGQPLYTSQFFDWSKHFDVGDHLPAVHAALVGAGFPPDIGALVDTGHNGWGGPDRPTEVSISTDLNTYVDESRLDRRPRRGAWCNQVGAGLGERPVASPAPGIDAYAWIRPPGESDGVADPAAAPDPDRPYLQPRDWCDPEYLEPVGGLVVTNARSGAPRFGHWFPEQFAELVAHAHPPVS